MPGDERPPGSPTLDRRVERLEREMAEFKTNLALIQAEQGHLRELVTTRFTEIANSQARVEQAIATLTASVQTTSTDPAASPLGRALATDISEAADEAKAAQEIAARVERRVIYATGVLGALIFLGTTFGPTVARLVFGLPS